jgi:hypothetical protein
MNNSNTGEFGVRGMVRTEPSESAEQRQRNGGHGSVQESVDCYRACIAVEWQSGNGTVIRLPPGGQFK